MRGTSASRLRCRASQLRSASPFMDRQMSPLMGSFQKDEPIRKICDLGLSIDPSSQSTKSYTYLPSSTDPANLRRPSNPQARPVCPQRPHPAPSSSNMLQLLNPLPAQPSPPQHNRPAPIGQNHAAGASFDRKQRECDVIQADKRTVEPNASARTTATYAVKPMIAASG